MAGMSSVGIGSGLDVQSIVSQLVALEKKPLDTLKLQATATQAKISAFGQLKSLTSTLQDAASKLASLTGWNGVKTSSSDASITVSAIGGTKPNSLSVQIQQLAKAQSQSSGLIPSDTAVGAGTLTLQLGTWSSDHATFTAGTTAAVSISVSASDTVADIASKINGSATAGVTATVLSDASGQRLLLRSKATGEAAGFQLSVADSDGDSTDASGLSRLVAGSGAGITEYGQNAKATVNGASVSSASNTFANTVSGVTFTATAVTTTAAQIEITADTDAMQANVEAFVKAYNDVNQLINSNTSYDAAAKLGGLLQGDSAAITLQNTLRSALQAVTANSSTFSRLSDIGVSVLQGGDLELDSSKLAKALENPDAASQLFRGSDTDLTDGFAEKFKAMTQKLLATDGFFSTKDASLQKAVKSNSDEQDKVNEKATNLETRLNARYAALDSQMASLNALNAYVTQQVTTWNKSTG
ncbi:flagellar filament capping protein FliD [Xylophilus sp.]|uniref:flagellar filament capping protein FliD n=1 Tax=Xylophilus sp. TaxID=2653893 RepID=UPI0013B61487|nr:flagellar filament capping protein FliD [Xylophilus sp.]KAF1047625.1 MAG: B-type flagellar hook-associated protein 2 [Xylophilus sp.]